MSTTPSPRRRARVAYILAPSHSGSTLLAMLLASHPDVTTVGELNLAAIDNPQTYLCSCGAPLGACAFWTRIADRMRDRGHAFDVTQGGGTDIRAIGGSLIRRLMRPLHRGPVLERARDLALAAVPAWRRGYPIVQARNGALVEAVTQETGARVVVDSSKIGIRLKFLLRHPDLDVRVIRLLRDGRAVALTYMDPAEFADARDPRRRGGGSGGAREAERLAMTAAAHEWRRSHEEGQAIVAGLPPTQWTEVRYEDLCDSTDQTLERLFAFLEVDPARPRADFRQAGCHVIGNGMRLDGSSTVAADTRWVSTLSEADRETFDRVAGALNRRFGYQS